jgi:putative ABC transport system ATP-binding protein
MCILEVALGNNPAVILTAEPTAALDSHRAQQVMELFAKIAHEENAVVK